MITVLGFVGAAAAGAVARAGLGHRWNRHEGMAWGTLAANVIGAFLLGCLSGTGAPAATVLGVAGLGAFTTFSSFARDLVALVELRQAATAGAYLLLTCVAGIAAAALGVALAS